MKQGTTEKRVATCGLIMVFALSAMTVGPGCSLLFVNGPPKPESPGSGTTDCTTSVALPVVDTLLSAYLLVNMFLNASRPASSFGMDGESVKTGAIVFGGGLTALTAISAGVGYSRVSDCKDYKLGDDDWTPAPRPRRRAAPPPPRAPEATPPAPAPLVPGAAAPVPAPAYPPPAGAAPVPGTAPPPATTPPPRTAPAPAVTPPAPTGPPAPQMNDDEAPPQPRPRPRSQHMLPATVPMVAAMPRLDERRPPSNAPRFLELPRFVHPWDDIATTVR